MRKDTEHPDEHESPEPVELYRVSKEAFERKLAFLRLHRRSDILDVV